jgi:hypothetical protein
MVKDLPLTAVIEKNKLDSSDPLVWLYEVRTKDDPPKMIRLTTESTLVSFKGNAYYPAPITNQGIEQTSEADIGGVDVLIGNASLEVAEILEASDGLIGQQVRITLIPKGLLGDPTAAISHEADIVGMSMSGGGIRLRLGARNAYQSGFPPFRYTRRRCRWLFGSVECGVNLDTSDGFSLSECPGYTLQACREVGDAEVAAGRDRLHPERFGGYPAIPKTRRF